MKNIYNLITDAFTRIGKDETEYSITIECTEYTLISYTITIKPIDPGAGSSTIFLLLNTSEELLDYYETNDLFESLVWERFCDVFEWQLNY